MNSLESNYTMTGLSENLGDFRFHVPVVPARYQPISLIFENIFGFQSDFSCDRDSLQKLLSSAIETELKIISSNFKIMHDFDN